MMIQVDQVLEVNKDLNQVKGHNQMEMKMMTTDKMIQTIISKNGNKRIKDPTSLKIEENQIKSNHKINLKEGTMVSMNNLFKILIQNSPPEKMNSKKRNKLETNIEILEEVDSTEEEEEEEEVEEVSIVEEDLIEEIETIEVIEVVVEAEVGEEIEDLVIEALEIEMEVIEVLEIEEEEEEEVEEEEEEVEVLETEITLEVEMEIMVLEIETITIIQDLEIEDMEIEKAKTIINHSKINCN
jgi:hypothetical protein